MSDLKTFSALVREKGATCVATFFGVGFSPKAPGTFGTLAAIPLVILLAYLGPFFYMGATLVIVLLGIMAAEAYQSRAGGHDRQDIVIDEVIGFLITMTWLPITWQSLVLGFVLFRTLDILKPFPIGYLDKKIQGGLGVVVDDMAAGIIASLILQYLYTNTSWLGVQIVTAG